MTITRRQANTHLTSSGSTLSTQLSLTPLQGNFLIAAVSAFNGYGYNASVASISTSQGVTWSLQKKHNTGDGHVYVEIWLGIVGSNAASDVTITLNNSTTQGIIAEIFEYSGLSNPTKDASSHADGYGTATSTGVTSTTTANEELWIGAVYQYDGSQSSPTNGFALFDGTANGWNNSFTLLEKIVSATGTAYSGTSGPGTCWCGCIATFKSDNLEVTGNLQVNGNATINNALSTNSLSTTGNATVGNALTVNGTIYTNYLQPISPQSNIVVFGNLTAANLTSNNSFSTTNATVSNELKLQGLEPRFTKQQLMDVGFGWTWNGTNWEWTPTKFVLNGQGENIIPVPPNHITFKDNDGHTGSDIEVFSVISSEDFNNALLTMNNGLIVQKDLHAGGVLSAEQGAVLLGHGLLNGADPPKILLTHAPTVQHVNNDPNLPALLPTRCPNATHSGVGGWDTLYIYKVNNDGSQSLGNLHAGDIVCNKVQPTNNYFSVDGTGGYTGGLSVSIPGGTVTLHFKNGLLTSITQP